MDIQHVKSCELLDFVAYHLKSSAQTGTPQPNMSTTFIGRSSAEELEWRLIPRSADPACVTQLTMSLSTNTEKKRNVPSRIG